MTYRHTKSTRRLKILKFSQDHTPNAPPSAMNAQHITVQVTDLDIGNVKGLPNYSDWIRRRLGDQWVSKGDQWEWTMAGRKIRVLITDIGNGVHDRVRIDRQHTHCHVERARPTGNPALDEWAESIQTMVRNAWENTTAFQTLGIPVAKSILVHGVSGVGKTRTIRLVSTALGVPLFELSVHDILALHEEIENPEFQNYNPLRLAMNRAISTSPAIVLLRDLNAVTDKIISLIAHEMDRIADEDKVCIIGLAWDLRSLPDALRRTDIFRQHYHIPIPNMQQRKAILLHLMAQLELAPLSIQKEPHDDYASQLSLRTSGYVARDLKLLCRNAVLKSQRRDSSADLLADMQRLRINEEHQTNPPSTQKIDWSDFEYALAIYKPSQQVDVDTVLPKKDWDDIGGYHKIKQRMKQAVLLPLLEPENFTRFGIPAPSGMLLYGPTGCGKTILVQALAAESTVNVISIKGPEIFSKYLGETEARIRRIFATAKRIAPCILFIDEMDSIASRRGWDSGESSGGVDERLLSTLLNEMDGVEGRRGVVVIGCTNRPDQIDDAVLRPGRLDQLVYVGLPEESDRADIVKVLMRKMAIGPNVDPEEIATQTPYCTGADIESIFREAGTIALRRDIQTPYIDLQDIESVIPIATERARRRVFEEKSLETFERFRDSHRVS